MSVPFGEMYGRPGRPDEGFDFLGRYYQSQIWHLKDEWTWEACFVHSRPGYCGDCKFVNPDPDAEFEWTTTDGLGSAGKMTWDLGFNLEGATAEIDGQLYVVGAKRPLEEIST